MVSRPQRSSTTVLNSIHLTMHECGIRSGDQLYIIAFQKVQSLSPDVVLPQIRQVFHLFRRLLAVGELMSCSRSFELYCPGNLGTGFASS